MRSEPYRCLPLGPEAVTVRAMQAMKWTLSTESDPADALAAYDLDRLTVDHNRGKSGAASNSRGARCRNAWRLRVCLYRTVARWTNAERTKVVSFTICLCEGTTCVGEPKTRRLSE